MKMPVLAGAATLALAAGVLIGGGVDTPQADAQSAFKVTPQQLQINQRISVAAVKRANESLRRLASLSAGPAGPQGPAGPAGPQGPAGVDATDTRWLLVNRAGEIEAQSGGFRIANAYPAGSAGEGNVYIESGDTDLSDNGIVATIALQNMQNLKGTGTAPDNSVDGQRVNGRNTGADLNPEFSGEISASRCNIPMLVACAPNDLVANGGDGMTANRDNYFVISPRNSDGTFTVNDSAPGAGDNTHKRFYVILTGPRQMP
ncbi:MAG: hypothetical protein RIB67_10420 [Miltoncostaeaceae bacterium]